MYENVSEEIHSEEAQTLTTTVSEQVEETPRYEQPPNPYAVPYAHVTQHSDDTMWRSLRRVDDLEGEEIAQINSLTASRHNSHYFSNTNLFEDSDYHHLHYAKYSELVTGNEFKSSPSLRVSHVSFALDSRTRFDKLCLRLASRVPVLQEVSFSLTSGDILAVLYTNDYEMRTLLELISGTHRESGKIRGEFLINGHKQRGIQLAQRVAHVREESNLPSNLTVLQYLQIEMGYWPPPRGKYPKIETILSSLALLPSRNRSCTSLGRAEKERLKIAAQILRETDILVCENITKDMDIYDAAFTIDYLRTWALKSGKIVLLAIQPSSLEMFQMFSKVLLLASGRITYFGPAEEMIPYFETIQFPCPMFRNPCDYYVDLATHDHLSEDASKESLRRISSLCSQWAQKEKPPVPPIITSQAPLAPKSGIFKTGLTLYRSLWLETLNSSFYLAKEIFLTLIISAFHCLLYSTFPETRRTTSDDREGIVASLLYFSLVSLSCFWIHQAQHDKKRLTRSQENSIVFIACLSLFRLPFSFLCSILLYLPVYLMTEFSISSFDIFQMTSFLFPLILFYSLAKQISFLFSFLFNSPKLSLLFNFLFLSFLFFWSGLPVTVEDQSSLFNLLMFLSPSYWISEILLQQQLLNYSMVSTIFDVRQRNSELLVGCERRQVLAKKIGDVPIFGVAHCSKFKGSQLLHFFGYQSSPLSLTSIAVAGAILSIWLLVATVLSCCLSSTQKKKRIE